MEIEKKTLLNTLESLRFGLADQNIIEQSSCFVFAGGMVVTFNDELSVRKKFQLPGIQEGAVAGKPLLELVSKLEEEHLDLSIEDGHLCIRGKGKRRAAITLEKEILLPFQSVDKPGKWIELDSEFSQAISICSECVSRDDDSFDLTCIHITSKFVESSDTFQSCRWSIETDIDDSILIRKETSEALSNLNVTKMSLVDKWVHFTNKDNVLLSCRTYDDAEEYPDLDQCFDVSGSEISFPQSIIESISKAEIFAKTGDGLIQIKVKKGYLYVKGMSDLGWYEERKKIDYKGKEFLFFIPPRLLANLITKYRHVIVSKNVDALKVVSDNYQYATSLSTEE